MMEAQRLPSAQRLSSDIISTLPQCITETILCLLPIEEAARTCILSRDWRYKWTTIPKLEFYESTVSKQTSEAKKISDKKSTRRKLLSAIQQVLSLRQGPIHEFALSMRIHCHCLELDRIILQLSRNHTVKKLTLCLDDTDRHFYNLPSCAFSMNQLTDLDLSYVDLDHPSLFVRYASLKSLCLNDVNIPPKALFHLLSNCPSLTSFTLLTQVGFGSVDNTDCNIIDLFQRLPVIEHLTTYGYFVLPFPEEVSVPKELPASLIHLKYICFKHIWFVDDGLPFLAVLIKSSPNLEKIRLEIRFNEDDKDDENDIRSGILEEYPDVRMEHLTELEIEDFSNLKPEMEFVKFILARSPKLKKVWISCVVETDEEESQILETLLSSPHASLVEIVVV